MIRYASTASTPSAAKKSGKSASVRSFPTGATRDNDADKLDYEACLSPLVLEEFAEYMALQRLQPDGSLRTDDNWQRGFPLGVLMKSMLRHVFDAWKIHRGIPAYDRRTGAPITMRQALCAVMFNCMGYLHEVLKAEKGIEPKVSG